MIFFGHIQTNCIYPLDFILKTMHSELKSLSMHLSKSYLLSHEPSTNSVCPIIGSLYFGQTISLAWSLKNMA